MASWKEVRDRSIMVCVSGIQGAKQVLEWLCANSSLKAGNIEAFAPLLKKNMYCVTVKNVSAKEAFLTECPLSIDGVTCEAHPAGQPRYLFRVHKLPYYVTNESLRNFFAKFGRVLYVKNLKIQTEGFAAIDSDKREVLLEASNITLVPHKYTMTWDGERFTFIITSPSRPARCFRCDTDGHTRADCQAVFCQACRAFHSNVCPRDGSISPSFAQVAGMQENTGLLVMSDIEVDDKYDGKKEHTVIQDVNESQVDANANGESRDHDDSIGSDTNDEEDEEEIEEDSEEMEHGENNQDSGLGVSAVVADSNRKKKSLSVTSVPSRKVGKAHTKLPKLPSSSLSRLDSKSRNLAKKPALQGGLGHEAKHRMPMQVPDRKKPLI